MLKTLMAAVDGVGLVVTLLPADRELSLKPLGCGGRRGFEIVPARAI